MPQRLPDDVTITMVPSTIKEKLLADIRAGEWNPNLLGKRHGLNGHDLVKNLEQLRKEGFIAFKWGLGDRVEKVWIPKGRQNMELLKGHTRKNGHIDYIEVVADAINQLPWGDRGFRVWSKSDVVKATGLKGEQVGHAIEVLRESGRMQQLGGGGRGLPIKGVRWRGERPPEAAEPLVMAEPATNGAKPAPEPAQSPAERYPMVSMIIQLGKELEELMK